MKMNIKIMKMKMNMKMNMKMEMKMMMINQNKIKKLNDYVDKTIDKSKSFEDQIKSLKKKRRFKKILPS